MDERGTGGGQAGSRLRAGTRARGPQTAAGPQLSLRVRPCTLPPSLSPSLFPSHSFTHLITHPPNSRPGAPTPAAGCAVAAVALYEGVRVSEIALRPLPRYLSAPVAGIMTGVIAYRFPQVRGPGELQGAAGEEQAGQGRGGMGWGGAEYVR